MQLKNIPVGLSVSLAVFPLFSQAQPKNPNIILINMDDMGYGDLTITGAINYRTPNIDKLAHDGMMFTQYYAAASVSSASRAGLLTGCYPSRIGGIGLFFPNSKKGLNPTEVIIPEMLKTKGYTSAIVGKWHLGDAPEFMPVRQGFDQYFGLPYSNDMWPYGNAKRGDQHPAVTRKDPPLWLIDGEKPVRELKTADDMDQLTSIYTQKAISFIQNNKKKPFFLYLAHAMPHIPLAVSEQFRGKSKQGEYGDVMMEVDRSVGEIVAELEKSGLTNNTLIIFTSDNGPWINFGDHGGSSGGFREGKFSLFEGGYRVPCIMKWPDGISAGLVCNQVISGIDIFPTLADICDAALPAHTIDGVSIKSLLKGNLDECPRRYFIYNELDAIRDEHYKLVLPHKSKTMVGVIPNDGGKGKNAVEIQVDSALYDLRRDPGERYNVLAKFPEVKQRLQAELNRYKAEATKNGAGFRAIGISNN